MVGARESSVAEFAIERFVPRVCQQVGLQVGDLAEDFVAVLALEDDSAADHGQGVGKALVTTGHLGRPDGILAFRLDTLGHFCLVSSLELSSGELRLDAIPTTLETEIPTISGCA